jgi:hypothetical protein
MRIKIKQVLLAVFITASVIANAQSIYFPVSKFNFGRVNEDKGRVSHVFKYVNTGKKPLKILNVHTTCGCTSPEWTRKDVQPGDTGQILVVFDPDNKVGDFSKDLNILTNGNPAQVSVTVEGYVHSPKREIDAMFPAQIGNLSFSAGELNLPAKKENKVDSVWLGIFNSSDQPIMIYAFGNAKSALVKAVPPSLSIGTRAGKNVLFLYDGSLAGGLGKRVDTIIIQTNDRDVPTKQIVIKANIVQNFDNLTPEQKANAPVVDIKQTEADLGQLYQGETGTFTFTITNTGKSDLIVRKVATDCKCITSVIPAPVKKGAKGKVVVSFNSKGRHRDVVETFTLITNDPKNPEITLTLKAKVVIPGKEPYTY